MLETVDIKITKQKYVRVCEGSAFVQVVSPPADEDNNPSVQFVFATSLPEAAVVGHGMTPGTRRFTDLEVVDLFLRATGKTVTVTVTRGDAK